MNKEKIEKIILFLIVMFGLNYLLYAFYFKAQFNQLHFAKINYDKSSDKVLDLRVKNVQLNSLKEKNEELKKQAVEADKLIPEYLNTPQLVYDFYAACKKFGVKGISVEFKKELQQGNEGNTAGQNANSSKWNIPNNEKYKSGEIVLKVSGDKYKVEDFIRSLDTISTSKLIIKAVTVSTSSGVPAAADSPQSLNGDITFVYFAQRLGETNTSQVSYDFYNTPIGFDRIADMFGKPNQSMK